MKLGRWMLLNVVRDEEMAKLASVDRATINRIRRGKHQPSWPLMQRIHFITKGEVSADDFLVPNPDPDVA